MAGPEPREILARWRETGEWWNHEPERDFVRFLDDQGIRREEFRELAPLAQSLNSRQQPFNEVNSEEIALRVRKVRDEKVARACGHAPTVPTVVKRASAHPYAALHTFSGYAFGRSTMLAEEIPMQAASRGIPIVGIADPHSLVGAVEFTKAALKHGVRARIGASIELPEGGEIVLIARSKRGYVALSRLITRCHLEEPRLYPIGTWDRLEAHAEDVLCLTGGDRGPLNRRLAGGHEPQAARLLERLIALYGRDNVGVEIERNLLPWERTVNARLLELADRYHLRALAGGRVTHSRPTDFPVQDILVCSDTLCTVDEILGRKPPRADGQPTCVRPPERSLNAEGYLRDATEMAARFADRPDLLENSLIFAERCDDEVLPPRTQLPAVFEDDVQALREVTFLGANRYHPRITPALRRRLNHEVDRIVRLNFASHFLVAWDMCRWAEEHGVQFSGRGSVVDSAVAYCLGFSRIDAFAHRLHFDRFLPDDGSKRPDIDIDFESKRRDDIRNYLIRKYGRDRVATVAAVGAYCSRGIIREVGKALGLPTETIGFLAKRVHGGVPADQIEAALDKRPELRGANVSRERFRWVFRLAERMMDVPRNMRAHSSGVVISDRPLDETVPVMWSAGQDDEAHLRIIQWDKRSAKYFFDKFDVLCLRGQDVLSGTERRLRRTDPTFDVKRLPIDDPETYRTMRSGQLIGIPQSASPAMRQAHIRLRTQNLEDASLVQAGIRPGVGGAVKMNLLIARRRGLADYAFEHPDLEKVLGHTYGIIVFQEQVDQLLQTFCRFSSGEAEEIRDAIHKRRREDYGAQLREELLRRIRDNGYSATVADHVVELVAGFKGYGFAQGHALAFAEISVRSIFCQQNFPAEYFAALLSAQPAGYYGPCTLANEARSRGVAMLPPDVLRSQEEFTVEDVVSPMDPKIALPNAGIRVGLMQIHGLSKETRTRITRFASDAPSIGTTCAGLSPRSTSSKCKHVKLEEARDTPPLGGTAPLTPPALFSSAFRSFFDFVAKVRPGRDELENLILCGALDTLHANRRAMLWAIPDAEEYAAGLAAMQGALPFDMPEPSLPHDIDDFSVAQRAVHERSLLGLDVRAHLMAFERERIAAKGGVPCAEAGRMPHGRKAVVVGNPIRLRFPPTPSGKRVVFFDLEDESGLLNVTCFDAVYQADGHAIVCSPYVTVIGEAQDRDGHIGFMARKVFPYAPRLAGMLPEASPLPVTSADFLVG